MRICIRGVIMDPLRRVCTCALVRRLIDLAEQLFNNLYSLKAGSKSILQYSRFLSCRNETFSTALHSARRCQHLHCTLTISSRSYGGPNLMYSHFALRKFSFLVSFALHTKPTLGPPFEPQLKPPPPASMQRQITPQLPSSIASFLKYYYLISLPRLPFLKHLAA